MTRPNSVTTDYAYDNLSRLLSVLHKLSGGTIDGATYTVDAVGNRTAKANLLPSAPTENYTYDAVYQLTQVVQNGSTTSESYTYDPVGNRLSSLAASPWNYNVSNQLTSIAGSLGTSFTYDANGNTTTKTDSAGTTTYTWDYENRLTSLTLPGSGGTVSFTYDPLGRRICKQSASATTVYAYDGGNIIEEADASGNAIARYAMGLSIDEPLAQLRSGATHYYSADGLGSITSLTDGSGAVAASYTYDAFGNLAATSGSVVNSFRYTAREWGAEIGLYFYRSRYYDISTGRFLSEDPASFDGGIDFYRYVNNNPANLVDPAGLSPDCKNCSIQVKCQGVQKFNLGRSGFRHCEGRVVDRNGITHSLSGGPEGDPFNSTLNAWDTPNPTQPFKGRRVYNKKNVDCDVVDCLVDQTNAFHNQAIHPKYKAFGGPNSNIWLKDTFRLCGIKLRIRWYGPPILFFWPLP